MTQTHPLFLFGHEFDEFLYAPIGEEENGMELNVMSALARRNVDPWHEAERLSRLPRDVATQELCVMVAELPPGAPNRASPRSIAERLIAPLPFSAGSKASSPRTGGGNRLAAARNQLSVTREQLESSPPWDPETMIDQMSEKGLHRHYTWLGAGF